MIQRANGEWQTETLPTRHKRREARWALEDASAVRLPIIGKADVPLQTVGMFSHVPLHVDTQLHYLCVIVPLEGLVSDLVSDLVSGWTAPL